MMYLVSTLKATAEPNLGTS